MVYHGFPQGPGSQSLIVNSNYAPQGMMVGGVLPPVEDKLVALYPPQADLDYLFYKFYQIKKNQVPSLQTDMPILITDTLGPGILLEDDGFDIRTFDSLGNSIPHETEFVDATTGAFTLWINMSQVVDHEFVQLTFGKSDAPNGSTPPQVYDFDYEAVYHLNQDTFPSLAVVPDSTVNFNDGEVRVFNPAVDKINSITGKISKAAEFVLRAGIDGKLVMSNMGAEATISMWASLDSLTGGDIPTYIGNDGGPNFQIFFEQGPNQIRFRYGNPSNDALILDNSSGIIVAGVLQYYSFVWNEPNDSVKMYVDGILVASKTISWISSNPVGETFIGQLSFGVPAFGNFNGIIDEVRFSKIERTADRILTEYNNQNDQDAFWFKTPTLDRGQTHLIVTEDPPKFIKTVQTL